jgi:hypothetical protein
MRFISTEVTYKAVQVCRWEYFVGVLVQADSRLRRRMLIALHGMCNLESDVESDTDSVAVQVDSDTDTDCSYDVDTDSD